MKSLSRLPPPPQQINDYLNGHIIGHYIMKKALSVAIYNHLSNISISRNGVDICQERVEDILVEDTKSVFNRIEGSSLGHMITGQQVTKKSNPRYLSEFHESPEIDEPYEYMTPIVTRVIIEASTHRVHLRKSNTLTFDSTGSSKPLNAIASTIAQFLDVPFVRCDCSKLTPVEQVEFKKELKDGTLAQLLSGYCSETINSTISRLYRKADFDLEKASRGIVFLDGMHKIGENEALTKLEQRQLLKEILQIIEGTTNVDVTRAGSSYSIHEVLETSKMFFICFGIFEAEEELLHHEFAEEFGEVFDNTHDEEHFKHSPEQNNNDVALENRRDSRTSNVSMDTVSSGSSGSNTSPEKSPERPESKNKSKHLSREESFLIKRPLRNARSDESDQSSYYSFPDDWNYSFDSDDSYQGLWENKLARLVTEAENSPIPQYQSLWGMKDVDLRFTPEALEIIANQAIEQQAGKNGVATILEKLFLTIKYDILGANVVAVEITEDFVLGKDSPIYYYAPKKKKSQVRLSTSGLCSILEEAASSLSDYELGIFEELEI